MKMEMETLKRVFAMCKGGNLMESLKPQGKSYHVLFCWYVLKIQISTRIQTEEKWS